MGSEPARGQASAGLSHQATIWLDDAKAEFLFGKLGTHCHLAGAQLQLKDTFFNSRMGRKLVVFAASRRVACSAIKSVLFQISHDLNLGASGRAGGGSLEPLEESYWSYHKNTRDGNDSVMERMGPFKHKQMLKWLDRGYFGGDDPKLPVQHQGTGVWVPVWYLAVASGHAEANGQQDEEMMDWEALVREVQEQRQGQDMLQLGEAVPDFPDLADEGAEAMDYDMPTQEEAAVAAGAGARVFVIVDTNILLSHLNYLERTLSDFAGAARQASQAGEAAVEVKLVVPYAVLSELDRLKTRQERDLAPRARRAINRLAELRSERDTWLLLQSAAEHRKVVEGAPVIEGADDIILQSAVYYRQTFVVREQRMNFSSAAFLLSNDHTLFLKAAAEGVQCFTAQSFPGGPRQLEQAVQHAQHGGQAQTDEQQQAHMQAAQHEPASAASPPPQNHQERQGQQQQQLAAAHSPLASPQSSGPLPDLHQQVAGSPRSAAAAAAGAGPSHPAAEQQRQQQLMQLAAQQLQAQQAQAQAQQTQQQQQQAQLAEQLRQLQMAAQAGSAQHLAAEQQQQAQRIAEQQAQAQRIAEQQAQAQRIAEQQAQLAAAAHMAVKEDHLRAMAVLQQAGPQQLESMLDTVARQVGMELQQLLVERQQWLAGAAPLSPQLEQAVGRIQQVAALYHQEQQQRQQQQQQQATALQHQQEQQQAAVLQQAAAIQQALAGHPQQQQLLLAALQAQGHGAAEAGLVAASAPTAPLQRPPPPHQHQQLQLLQQQLSLGAAQGSGELQLLNEAAALAVARQRSGPLQVAATGPHPAAPRQGPGAGGADAAAQALAARRVQAAGLDLQDVLQQLSGVVLEGVEPIVKYHLQQQLGAGWDYVADAEEAWDAAQTLRTIYNRDGNFFWRGTTILQDSWRQGERRGGKLGDLERFLGGGRGGRRQPPSYAHLVEAAQDVLALLHSFQATANFPHKDPEGADQIGDTFVSLESAKEALAAGVQRCQALLALLNPGGLAH